MIDGEKVGCEEFGKGRRMRKTRLEDDGIQLDDLGRVILDDVELDGFEALAGIVFAGANSLVCNGTHNNTCTNITSCSDSQNAQCSNPAVCSDAINSHCGSPREIPE